MFQEGSRGACGRIPVVHAPGQSYLQEEDGWPGDPRHYTTNRKTMCFSLFKHVYSAAQPILDQYGGHSVSSVIMKELNSYDNIKSQAMNVHTELEGNIHNLQNSLVKKRYNFIIA